MSPGLGVIGLIALAVLMPVLGPAQATAAASPEDEVGLAVGPAVGSAVSVASAAVPLRAVRAASLQQIGTSPATPVVDTAPRAVSVTFDGAPDRDGASMKIFGPSGEVSAAQPQVDGNAVRRPLDKSVPAGKYVVTWNALGQDGEKLSGSFTFSATHGSGTYAPEPVPSGEVTIAPLPSSSSATSSSLTSPSATASSTSSSTSSSPSSSTSSVTSPSAETPSPQQTSASAVAGGSRGTGEAERISTASGSLPARWIAVPVVLVALLILASAAVGMVSGAGARARSRSTDDREIDLRGADARVQLFVHRGPTLPWQRHQS